MAILESLAAAAGGTITGSIAGVGTAWIQAELQKARLPLELKMLERDVDVAKQHRRMENDAQMEETRRTESTNDADVHIAALEADKATYNNWFIDGIRGLVRPLITGWCVYVLSDMTIIMWELGGEDFDSDYIQEIFRHLVVTWTYLCSSVIMYWFGSRGGRAPTMR